MGIKKVTESNFRILDIDCCVTCEFCGYFEDIGFEGFFCDKHKGEVCVNGMCDDYKKVKKGNK